RPRRGRPAGARRGAVRRRYAGDARPVPGAARPPAPPGRARDRLAARRGTAALSEARRASAGGAGASHPTARNRLKHSPTSADPCAGVDAMRGWSRWYGGLLVTLAACSGGGGGGGDGGAPSTPFQYRSSEEAVLYVT